MYFPPKKLNTWLRACSPGTQERTSSRRIQGRNDVIWRPWHEASLAVPYSHLRSFGRKCTVLKKVLVKLLGLNGTRCSHLAPPEWFGAPIVVQRPGNCAPCPPPRYAHSRILSYKEMRTFGRICARQSTSETINVTLRRRKTKPASVKYFTVVVLVANNFYDPFPLRVSCLCCGCCGTSWFKNNFLPQCWRVPVSIFSQ